MTDEIVTYLSMTDPSALVWPRVVPAFDFHRVQPADPDRLRGFYHDVGAAYQWRDRLGWSAADWAAHARRPGVSLWVAEADRSVGFCELAQDQAGGVEIAYFGLLPAFVGHGYGGAVLAAGVAAAWQLPDTQRVWLHTCNFDHSNALSNYRARGFGVDRVVTDPSDQS